MSYEEAIRDFNSNSVSTAANSFITKTTHAPRPSVPLKCLAIIVFSVLVCGRGLAIVEPVTAIFISVVMVFDD